MREEDTGITEYDRLARHAEEERAVREAGGGESEGFEEAERQLIENASHENPTGPDPTHMAGEPEEAKPDAEFGEADASVKYDA